MNIFPKRKQIKLIPRDFTLSSKAFSRTGEMIKEAENLCSICFATLLKKKKKKLSVKYASGSLLWEVWFLFVSLLLSYISQCALPSSYTLATLFFFHPLMYTMFPPTSGPLHILFILFGMYSLLLFTLLVPTSP